MFRLGLLSLSGFSFGMLAAAGVFTVLSAVGLVPRFAGKTHSAREILLYENMVIAGTVAGGLASVFERYLRLGGWILEKAPGLAGLMSVLVSVFLGAAGIFCGMFVGALALAIAEMLDSIPIFTRRVSFRHGLGLAVLSMALGKLAGSLFYFWSQLHRTAG